MSLVKLTQHKQELTGLITVEEKTYNTKMLNFSRDLYDTIRDLHFLAAELNIDKINIANQILETQGKITNICEGRMLADAACDAIVNNGLKDQYLGNKRYDSFYQKENHKYGYGPKHGSIVERVGLQSGYREHDLTDEEKEACIYYLKNFDRIKSEIDKAIISRNKIIDPQKFEKNHY